jgi:hypothetical protein
MIKAEDGISSSEIHKIINSMLEYGRIDSEMEWVYYCTKLQEGY